MGQVVVVAMTTFGGVNWLRRAGIATRIEQKRLAVRQYDEDRPAVEIMPPNPPKFPLTQSIVQQRFTSNVSQNETSCEHL
jgi:hypothetical protein